MKIGDIYAFRRPYDPQRAMIDGLPNYAHLTYKAGLTLPLPQKGIYQIARIQEHERVPAIIISASPHKSGNENTPWQNFFDPDNGHIRYYGDNKTAGKLAEESEGNKILLKAFNSHSSGNELQRKKAIPIIFFNRVIYNGKLKGNLKFQGFGIIEKVERITQYNIKTKEYFSNYVFDFAVLNMQHEAEKFDWEWINRRRDPHISNDVAVTKAPDSWEQWVIKGNSALEELRRKVSKLYITPIKEQETIEKTEEEKVLKEIYNFYSNKKNVQFEWLASIIAANVIAPESRMYKKGWVTSASNDGGLDFVGRLDIGTGFSKVKIIVIGQAKCEDPKKTTNGKDIARTVARLKKGWIGVYVTTGMFSKPVQAEIIDDAYPLMLINGLRVAEEVIKIYHKSGYKNAGEYLQDIDKQYKDQVQSRRPEEILYE